jgi:hypothetical protein
MFEDSGPRIAAGIGPRGHDSYIRCKDPDSGFLKEILAQEIRSIVVFLKEILAVFLDNGKIALILVLALKEATANLTLTSMKVTTKYNHRPESTIIRSAQTHTDKLT